MKPLYDLRLSVLAEAYREGQIAPREVITALRERALALNPSFNAFIYLLTPEELEPYLAALEGVAPDTLPLFGVPLPSKTISIWQVSTPPPPVRHLRIGQSRMQR